MREMTMRYKAKMTTLALSVGLGALLASGCVLKIGTAGSGDGTGNGQGAAASGSVGVWPGAAGSMPRLRRPRMRSASRYLA